MADSRSQALDFLYIKNSKSVVSFLNIMIQVGMLNSFLAFINDQVYFTSSTMELDILYHPSSADAHPALINCTQSNSIIVISLLNSTFNYRNFLYSDSNTTLNFEMALGNDFPCVFVGSNNLVSYSYIYSLLMTTSYFTFSPSSHGNSVQILHSISYQATFPLFYMYSGQNSIYCLNFTVLDLRSTFMFNFNTLTPDTPSNQLIIDQSLVYGVLTVMGFITTWSSLNVTISNSNFTMIYMVANGIFTVLGEFNIMMISNTTFSTVSSFTAGAIYGCIGGKNSVVKILNSSFWNVSNDVQGSFVGTDTNLTINNTVFDTMTASAGVFAILTSSNIIMFNSSVKNVFAPGSGIILFFYNDVQMIQTNFSGVTGDVAAYAQAYDTHWVFDQVIIDNFTFKTSFLKIEQNCLFEIISSQFSGISGNNLMIAERNNTLNISGTDFFDIKLAEGGLFSGKFNNIFLLDNVNISSVSSEFYGTLFYAFEGNSIKINKLVANSISAVTNGIFFILKQSSLIISFSNFTNCSSLGLGGIVYATQGVISVDNCLFNSSSAKIAGNFYISKSRLSVTTSEFVRSSANVLASVIYSENSDIAINKTNFSMNILKSFSQTDDSVLYFLNSEAQYSMTLNGVVFTNDGINSTSLIFIDNGELAHLANITFLMNSQSSSLMRLIDVSVFMNNISFINNSLSFLVVIIQTLPNSSFGLDTLNFENNTFSAYLISIDIKSGGFMINVNFKSNHMQGIKGTLTQIYNTESFVIANSLIQNNLNQDASNIFRDGIMFYIVNCQEVVFTSIKIQDNFAQALYAYDSSIKIINFISIRNQNYLFISTLQSNLTITDSKFSDHNNFSLDANPISIKLINSQGTSNLSITNSTFINNQNFSIIFQNVTMYEIDLSETSSLQLKECTFLNAFSFFVKADSMSSIVIDSSIFQLTQSTKSRFLQQSNSNMNTLNSGSVFLSNVSSISINNTTFNSLGSPNGYSGLHIESFNSLANISLMNSNFLNNKASQGGAFSFLGKTAVSILNTSFLSNQAKFTLAFDSESGIGGALFSKCVAGYTCILNLKSTQFKDNMADLLGGAAFLENYNVSSISDTIFDNNPSGKGNNSDIMQSPYFINFTKFVDENNRTINISNFSDTDVLEINNGQTNSLSFSIFDSSNVKCIYDSNSPVLLSESPNNKDHFTQIKGSSTLTSEGTIQFSSLNLIGQLNTTYQMVIEKEGLFKLKRPILIKIRLCRVGEYYEPSVASCSECPYGSYSLVDPVQILPHNQGFKMLSSTVCKPCPLNSVCQGAKIAPLSDYWRSPEANSTKIIKCPIQDSCLYEDLSTFNNTVLCAPGYKGPLCVQCETGYAKDSFSSQCLLCQETGKYYGIFIGKMIFMLVFVSFQVLTRLYGVDSKKEDVTATIIKIVRDHLNQIFMLFTIADFLKATPAISNAHDDVNNIVTGVTLNVNCFVDESKMKLLFFLILIIIISPIYMIVFVGAAFFLLFLVKKIMKKKVTFKNYLKTVVTAFIVICDTQYAQITVAFLALFHCAALSDTNSQSFLLYSPNVACNSDEHDYYFKAMGLPTLFIWILGLPITFFAVLTYLRRTAKRSTYSLQTVGTTTALPQITSLQGLQMLSEANMIDKEEGKNKDKNNDVKIENFGKKLKEIDNNKEEKIQDEGKNKDEEKKMDDEKVEFNHPPDTGTRILSNEKLLSFADEKNKKNESKNAVENENNEKNDEKDQTKDKKAPPKPGAFEIDLEAKFMLSFLFIEYKEDRYFWASMIMIWKFILAVLATFVNIELVFSMLFIFYFCMILIYVFADPYKFEDCYHLTILSFFINLTTVTLFEYGQRVPDYNTIIVIVYFVIQFAFFGIAIIMFVKDYDYKPIITKVHSTLKKKESSQKINKLVSYLEKRFSYTTHSNTMLSFGTGEGKNKTIRDNSKNLTQIEMTNAESKEELIAEKKHAEDKVSPKEIKPIIEEDSIDMVEHNVPEER